MAEFGLLLAIIFAMPAKLCVVLLEQDCDCVPAAGPQGRLNSGEPVL